MKQKEGLIMVAWVKKGFSGTTLKLITILTMIIDHIGVGIIKTGILKTNNEEAFVSIMETEWGRWLFDLDMLLRCIGRISAQLFLFLLVEGFLHTKNMKKYL